MTPAGVFPWEGRVQGCRSSWARLSYPHAQIKEHRCRLDFQKARVIFLDGDRRGDCEMIYGFSLQHEQRPFDRLQSRMKRSLEPLKYARTRGQCRDALSYPELGSLVMAMWASLQHAYSSISAVHFRVLLIT